ncbi:aminopeptidase P family protein [Sediminibacterium soli]|uniref:aminopeptidase P family protein n=1 Tax=Sediminibacterium soli TaxID=2698829 RepID=UPI00137B7BEA|nr:aminopeptidase P family protein [Sediminibacterium soli]NCI45572.1 aminopeptidase P family protein [Sediminibacterium soli]
MIRKLLLGLLALPLFSTAQQTTEYPNDYLSPEFHAGRRAAFKALMPKNSVAFFFASQVRVRNNDVDYMYAQSKNFYYFTGLEEPNSLLVLFKEPVTILGATGTEFLFVQPRNPQQEMWTGKILGVEGVKDRYKFVNVFTHDKFTASTVDLGKVDSVFTLFRGEEILAKFKRPDPLSRMAMITDSLIVSNNKPVSAGTRGMMAKLRGIKQPEEIAIMEKVVNMSVAGHNEVMKSVKPGMTEYQAQAVMEYMFKKNGSEFVGYPSINGSGANSCILHYETNQRLMKNGDLLLSDCAAEYHGYSADVTRTIPVNGKFTAEQKIIYELVLEAQDSAFLQCKPGVPFREVHSAAARVIARGLQKLGIISEAGQARTYFPHGTSHHLGLDVHDLGSGGPLEPGACFTVEPGIYIPPNSKCDPKWWNIGVRIEDDILITANGYRNLSAGAPRTVADIEKMAKQKSVFK